MATTDGRSMVLERSSGQDPAAVLRTQQAEQMLEAIANRLAGKMEIVVRDQVRQEVLPRLDEMEGKIEAVTSRVGSLTTGLPSFQPADGRALQRQAQDRVD